MKHGSLSPIVVPVKVIEKVRPDGLFAAFGADLKVLAVRSDTDEKDEESLEL